MRAFAQPLSNFPQRICETHEVSLNYLTARLLRLSAQEKFEERGTYANINSQDE